MPRQSAHMRMIGFYLLLALGGALAPFSVAAMLSAWGLAVLVGLSVRERHETRFLSWLFLLAVVGGCISIAADLWHRFNG